MNLSPRPLQVTSPSGDPVYDSSDGEKDGSFDYYATMEGMYTICFANEQPGAAARVTAKITVGDPPDLIQLAKTEHLSPIEERIKSLHESMNAVRDLQDQMREQDEAQSKMTRSTRSWLLYFTLLEALILIGVTAWQKCALPMRAAEISLCPRVRIQKSEPARRCPRHAAWQSLPGVVFRGQASRMRPPRTTQHVAALR